MTRSLLCAIWLMVFCRLAGVADAAIIYWNSTDLSVSTAAGAAIYWDLQTGAVDGNPFAGADFFALGDSGALELQFGGYLVTQTGQVLAHDDWGTRLPSGALISATSGSYGSPLVGDYNNTSFWDGYTGTGYVGFRFDVGGGNWSYGWAQFSYDDPANTITLLDFAYNSTPNSPILAGQQSAGPIAAVPEPSTVFLFGVGGLTAFSALRRRRSKNHAAAAAEIEPEAAAEEPRPASPRVRRYRRSSRRVCFWC